MLREIQAKTLLTHITTPDPWFGLKYNFNLYRGCQHRCIYCDSRSECYGIADFDGEVLVKANAIELLDRELASKRVKGTVGTGSMNDPYMPVEAEVQLTRRALEVILRRGFGVHINTKSDLIVRDADLLAAIGRVHASVCFTITTADDALALKLEPGAPPSSARWRAMQALAGAGVRVGVALMPVLPFIEDTPENITAIAEQTAAHGGQFILPAFSVTLRNRQRDYFYARLDELFPGLRRRYERAFGLRYSAHCPNRNQLWELLKGLCDRYGLATEVPKFSPNLPVQGRLF